ncbi:MAG: hypothetical protein HY912_16465 [Desulfomonile tiedjei]|uniref:Uncharacterized protein n=1 Tax=Desulfomonile tiedjei TaxID=2358 RepID=A0A9D6Z1H4_9BACT|nr:hypothetical protein [Desulfomonile tiedjei]
MMAKLQIPQQHVAGLIKIRILDGERLNELTAALVDAPPVLQRKELMTWLATRMTSIAESELDEILGTLIGMSSTLFQFNLSSPEFAERVCEAMQQSDNEELTLIDKDREGFKNRLIQLLDLESLLYPAKAFNILYDHERVFIQASAVTDVRAVFGPDPEVPPRAAAIIHMLNITCQRGDEEENIYVAMDTQDLESLIATLRRALSKTKSLKKVLGGAGITCLNPE